MKYVYIILSIIFATILIVFILFYKTDLSKKDLSKYINNQSKFIVLKNGANVHYRDEGNKSKPVLLMLHGGFGSLHNWEGWVTYLKNDFRLISLDLPAHGLTGKIPSNVYTRKTMIETVGLLMKELKIDAFSVAGNSMGGGLALQYALDYPKKINSLILIGSEGIPNGEDGYDISMFSDEKILAPSDPGYKKLSFIEKIMSRFIGPDVIKMTLNELVADKSLLTDEFIDYFGKIIRYKGNREANLLMFRQWFLPDANPRDLEGRLKEINIPVLYMHGEKDILVPLNLANKFNDLLPNSKLIIYKDAGHMSMIEKPKETAKDVIEFFKEYNISTTLRQ